MRSFNGLDGARSIGIEKQRITVKQSGKARYEFNKYLSAHCMTVRPDQFFCFTRSGNIFPRALA